MKKVLLTGEEARTKLISGLNKIADCVAVTLGPSGRNSIIDRPFQNPLITNDGVTVAKEIVLDDEIEELGAKVIKEATKRTNDEAGDGTTTTTVILKSLVNSVTKNTNPLLGIVDVMDTKREIDSECKKAVELLKEMSKPVETLEDITNIASVSMENEKVGEIIAKLFHELGKDAVVNVEMGSGFEIESEVKDGFDFPFGMVSPYMANQGKVNETTTPLVLTTNIKVNQSIQLQNLVTLLRKENLKDIIIFAEHFDKEVIFAVNQLRQMGALNCVLVQVPMGKHEFMEDICAITGATFLDEAKGDKLEAVTIEMLGKVNKVVISKDDSILIGKSEKTKLAEEKSEYEKDKLTKRIAKLQSKVGVITVGGKTEADKEYLKLKIDDAVNATKCAMQEGYVKGGGLALKEIAEQMKDSILYEALKSPYNTIMKNAGRTIEIPDNVIDPTKVTRTALENACSIAGIFLTTDVAIADKFEKPRDIGKD